MSHAHGYVQVGIHDTDAATWATLAKVFPVKSAETSTWIELVDRATDIKVTFFKSGSGDEPAETEAEAAP
jgi:hypothetical protein